MINAATAMKVLAITNVVLCSVAIYLFMWNRIIVITIGGLIEDVHDISEHVGFKCTNAYESEEERIRTESDE